MLAASFARDKDEISAPSFDRFENIVICRPSTDNKDALTCFQLSENWSWTVFHFTGIRDLCLVMMIDGCRMKQ